MEIVNNNITQKISTQFNIDIPFENTQFLSYVHSLEFLPLQYRVAPATVCQVSQLCAVCHKPINSSAL